MSPSAPAELSPRIASVAERLVDAQTREFTSQLGDCDLVGELLDDEAER